MDLSVQLRHVLDMQKYPQYVHLEAICALNATCDCGYGHALLGQDTPTL